jgi:hypothetical protein
MLGAAGQLMQVNCKVGGLAEQIRAQGDQLRALTEVVRNCTQIKRVADQCLGFAEGGGPGSS